MYNQLLYIFFTIGGYIIMDIFEVGLRVKEIRKKRHFTQEQFAEKIDVSPHYVYEIERGLKTMSIYTLANIASALDVSIDYLINGTTCFPNDESTNYILKDDLDLLIDSIPKKRRNTVRNVLAALLPYIK